MSDSERPLSLGEILDRSVQLYRAHFLLFTGLGVVPCAVGVAYWGGIAGLRQAMSRTGVGDHRTAGLIFVAYLLLGAPVALAFSAWLRGAENFAALQIHRGERATFRSSAVYAFSRFRRHFWLFTLETMFSWVIPGVVSFIAVFGLGVLLYFVAPSALDKTNSLTVGFTVLGLGVLLVAACAWIWLRYSLAFAGSVAEELPARAAMRRSSSLSKGARGRVFVLCLMVYVLNLTIYFAINIPAGHFLHASGALGHNAPSLATAHLKQALSFGTSFLLSVLLRPVYVLSLMLFYYDQRTRKEGYDIEQLMARAGWAELPLSPVVSASESGMPVLERAEGNGVNLESQGPGAFGEGPVHPEASQA